MMSREFGYCWRQFNTNLAVAIVLGTGFVFWRRANLDVADAVILTIAIGWFVFVGSRAMAKVHITESDIHISFLLPLIRTGGRFRHEEIESYASVRFSRKEKTRLSSPFAGVLQPKGKKPIWIWARGTKDFEDLDMILSALFPEPATEA